MNRFAFSSDTALPSTLPLQATQYNPGFLLIMSNPLYSITHPYISKLHRYFGGNNGKISIAARTSISGMEYTLTHSPHP